jgi:hypothetical protein
MPPLPTFYERGYSFEGFQGLNLRTPLPGNKLDAEFDDIATSIASIYDGATAGAASEAAKAIAARAGAEAARDDLLEELNFRTPEYYGASAAADADPAANRAALETAFNVSTLLGVRVRFDPTKLYRTAKLLIPANAVVVGHCRLRPIITVQDLADPVDIRVGTGVTFENDLTIDLDVAPGLRHTKTLEMGDRVRVRGDLTLTCAAQTQAVVAASGDYIQIGFFRSSNIDRPFQQQAASLDDGVSAFGYRYGLKIYGFDVFSYVRGMRFNGCSNFEIGMGRMYGRAPSAGKNPGNNSFLIGGCQEGVFLGGELSDAGEHAIRIGGPGNGYVTTGLSFGRYTVRRCGGCAFKSNDGSSWLGVKNQVSDVDIESITGYDIGFPTASSNAELFRLTHVRNFTIGKGVAKPQQTAKGCWRLLTLSDADGVKVKSLSGVGVRRAVDIISDGDWAGPTPDVRNIVIDFVDAKVDGSNVSVFGFNLAAQGGSTDPEDPSSGPTPLGTVGDFRILNAVITGTSTLASWGGGTLADGDVFIKARCVGPAQTGEFLGVAGNTDINNERIRIDTELDDGTTSKRYVGRADRYLPRVNTDVGAFDATDINKSAFGPTVRVRGLAAMVGTIWTILTSERPGTERRAWTLASEQDTSDVERIGLSLWRSTNISSNALTRWARLHSNGNAELNFAGRGLILTSPDGLTKKLISIDNTGAIITTTVS